MKTHTIELRLGQSGLRPKEFGGILRKTLNVQLCGRDLRRFAMIGRATTLWLRLSEKESPDAFAVDCTVQDGAMDGRFPSVAIDGIVCAVQPGVTDYLRKHCDLTATVYVTVQLEVKR